MIMCLKSTSYASSMHYLTVMSFCGLRVSIPRERCKKLLHSWWHLRIVGNQVQTSWMNLTWVLLTFW
jgi:hypothetical protein